MFRGEKVLEDLDFSLIYQGPLPSAQGDSSRAKDKQRIRRALHVQLKELWRSHPALKYYQDECMGEGSMVGRQLEPVNPKDGSDDEDPPAALFWKLGGFRFLPLITSHLSLIGNIEIDFFRQGRPGDLVFRGGDLDNRVKTLVDALRMPRDVGELAGDTASQPDEVFYTVLEDDSLIYRLAVETNQLLAPILPDSRDTDVWLRIRVTTTATTSNIMSVGL